MNEIYKTSSQNNIVTSNPFLNLRTKTQLYAAIIRTGIVGQVGHEARGTGSK